MSGAKLPHEVSRAFEAEVRESVLRLQALAFVRSFIANLSDVSGDIRFPEMLPSDCREFATHLIARLSSQRAEIDLLHYARHALRIGCSDLSVALAKSFICGSEPARSAQSAEVILEAAAIIDGVGHLEPNGFETPSSYEVHLKDLGPEDPRGRMIVFSVDTSGHARPVDLNPSAAAYLATATWD